MPDNIDIQLCRGLLSEALKLVKEAAPRLNTREAWVWNAGRGHWEFHGPNKFYWHGRADNAYDARYKGWMAWLEKIKGIE